MLKETFTSLLVKFTSNDSVINKLWTEIEENYSSSERHYHTLDHLENLLAQLIEVKRKLHDWETILFSLYYHDIVFEPLRNDNEEKSAELAEKRMKQISVPDQKIRLCKEQILATKSHINSAHSDTNYFIDADLSILGQPWETYFSYCRNVRKEYSVYPDPIYNKGRKNVLNRFLSMDRIFNTTFFYEKFERQARENLQREIQLLGDI